MTRTRRTNFELKYEILNILSDKKSYSYSYLEKKIKSHWETIKYQCEELEIFNSIIIENSRVQITDLGFEHLEKIKKKLE